MIKVKTRKDVKIVRCSVCRNYTSSAIKLGKGKRRKIVCEYCKTFRRWRVAS